MYIFFGKRRPPRNVALACSNSVVRLLKFDDSISNTEFHKQSRRAIPNSSNKAKSIDYLAENIELLESIDYKGELENVNRGRTSSNDETSLAFAIFRRRRKVTKK